MVLTTQTANVASIRLAAKLGFTEVERFEAWGAEQWLGIWSPITFPHENERSRLVPLVQRSVVVRPDHGIRAPVVRPPGMEFFCYHRDRPGSAALRAELMEKHWAYMDRFAAEMIARGPTLDRERDTVTGSVHIVDLPDLAAARAFVFDEPNYQAGVYRDVLLRRWRNVLGQTMWEFPGGSDGGNRYLVLGLGPAGAVGVGPAPPRKELIAYGPLLADDGTTWLGTAALVRAPDARAARAVLASDRYAGVEVHEWQFGGRR